MAAAWRRRQGTPSSLAAFLGFTSIFADRDFRHVWMDALFNHGQVVEVFHSEDIEELVIEKVFLRSAFARERVHNS